LIAPRDDQRQLGESRASMKRKNPALASFAGVGFLIVRRRTNAG
jgi:hypothetical protein